MCVSISVSHARLRTVRGPIFLIVFNAIIIATIVTPPATCGAQRADTQRHATKAIVTDDRLSALRRTPDLKGTVTRRLHLGRKVWILSEHKGRRDEPTFFRVAVSKRTIGWLHAGALSMPGRKGDDEKLFGSIRSATDSFDRLTLCKLFLDNFSHSPLFAEVMFTLGDEAERAAATLSTRSTRRLAKLDLPEKGSRSRDYYLSDSGLDRYSRLGIVFEFDPGSEQYVYDGKAFRELVRRYPGHRLSEDARTRLAAIEQRLSHLP